MGACCQFTAYKSPVVNLVYNSVISCHMARFSKYTLSCWELDNVNATEYQYGSFTALCQSSLRICWAGVVTALENWVCSFPEDKYTIFESTYKEKNRHYILGYNTKPNLLIIGVTWHCKRYGNFKLQKRKVSKRANPEHVTDDMLRKIKCSWKQCSL